MKSLDAKFLSSLLLALLFITPASAEPVTPAASSKDRKTIMDTLRQLPEVEGYADDAGGKIVFKVRSLFVDQDVALADVTPCTEDLKTDYPHLLAFLRRGGDEPWEVRASGKPQKKGGWVQVFFDSFDGPDFQEVWAVYNSGGVGGKSGSGNSQKVTDVGRDDPERKPIIDAVRSLGFIVEMKNDLGKDIIFSEVKIKKSATWAWFEGNPRTADSKWQGEPVAQLLRKISGKWKPVTGVPEEVIMADDSDLAFTEWRESLLNKYPDLPPALVPLQ